MSDDAGTNLLFYIKLARSQLFNQRANGPHWIVTGKHLVKKFAYRIFINTVTVKKG